MGGVLKVHAHAGQSKIDLAVEVDDYYDDDVVVVVVVDRAVVVLRRWLTVRSRRSYR